MRVYACVCTLANTHRHLSVSLKAGESHASITPRRQQPHTLDSLPHQFVLLEAWAEGPKGKS